jgi:catechol 2,3-dioxygenase-like lactoylglutathione lyase family enzyme
MTAAFATVTPLVPAGASLESELEFYVGRLGFEVVWRIETMAGVRRGDVSLNLIVSDEPRWSENASCGIAVAGLDALHDEYRRRDVRVGALETKAWGRREFHLVTPSGVCFQFYEKES